MNAVIVSIGTELVAGQSVDTNAAWLSARLTRLGIRVLEHITVGDDLAAIRGAVTRALDASELVIVTGGLGPTPDDLTREALAAAIGRPLEQNAGGLFERWQRPMPDSNKVQAMIPAGCDVIPNDRGTAPGIRYDGEGGRLFALPGVPAEMQAMFEAGVAPVLAGQTAGEGMREGRVLCFGISEARIGELLGDLMRRDRNPLVGTTASHGVIGVRGVARGDDQGDAETLLAADLAQIRRRLGPAVFGEEDDTLESVVARLLWECGRTVATAESCTGGLLAKRLTDIPGSSAYFLQGYVTYSNQAKCDLLGVPSELIASHGAVSEPVARAMASGCRTAAGADYAVSITGIAGPAGGSPPEKPVGLIYLGLAHGAEVEVKRQLFGDHLGRAEIRGRACSVALNMLRLRLLEEGGAHP
jgi:nicotinamide-nucleotide amidase